MSHLVYTLLMAILFSTVMAMLGNRAVRERLYVAVYMFLSCLATIVAGSWLMFLIHG